MPQLMTPDPTRCTFLYKENEGWHRWNVSVFTGCPKKSDYASPSITYRLDQGSLETLPHTQTLQFAAPKLLTLQVGIPMANLPVTCSIWGHGPTISTAEGSRDERVYCQATFHYDQPENGTLHVELSHQIRGRVQSEIHVYATEVGFDQTATTMGVSEPVFTDVGFDQTTTRPTMGVSEPDFTGTTDDMGNEKSSRQNLWFLWFLLVPIASGIWGIYILCKRKDVDPFKHCRPPRVPAKPESKEESTQTAPLQPEMTEDVEMAELGLNKATDQELEQPTEMDPYNAIHPNKIDFEHSQAFVENRENKENNRRCDDQRCVASALEQNE